MTRVSALTKAPAPSPESEPQSPARPAPKPYRGYSQSPLRICWLWVDQHIGFGGLFVGALCLAGASWLIFR